MSQVYSIFTDFSDNLLGKKLKDLFHSQLKLSLPFLNNGHPRRQLGGKLEIPADRDQSLLASTMDLGCHRHLHDLIFLPLVPLPFSGNYSWVITRICILRLFKDNGIFHYVFEKQLMFLRVERGNISSRSVGETENRADQSGLRGLGSYKSCLSLFLIIRKSHPTNSCAA